MVQNVKGISTRSNAERNAMPVMIPGSAIGSTTKSEITSRPKNFEPDTAAAQSVPSMMASAVEIAATSTDSSSASHRSDRSAATANHLMVRPGGGHWKVRSSVVKA